MHEFRQYWKRSDALFGLVVALVFVLLPLDSEYTNWVVEPGMSDSPWFYWGLLGLGTVCAAACGTALVWPPLILAADREGLAIGVHTSTLSIGRERARPPSQRPPTRSTFRGSRRAVRVPWSDVELIAIGTIRFTAGSQNSRVERPALKIVCTESIDLSRCDNMFTVQAGTQQYFAAADERPFRSVTWEEPGGCAANQNVILFADRCFDGDVHQICDRLQGLAATYGRDKRAESGDTQ